MVGDTYRHDRADMHRVEDIFPKKHTLFKTERSIDALWSGN